MANKSGINPPIQYENQSSVVYQITMITIFGDGRSEKFNFYATQKVAANGNLNCFQLLLVGQHKSYPLNRRLHNLTDKQTNEPSQSDCTQTTERRVKETIKKSEHYATLGQLWTTGQVANWAESKS